jgi:hypothetical protein
MFRLRPKTKLSVKVKGLFNIFPIQWEDRLKGRRWIDIQGQFEPQRWGMWDSDSCWALSCINSYEDQLELLKLDGYFSQEALDFFTSNGYVDSVGDFSLSERFIEILGKNKLDGGTSEEAWQLCYANGCIPRKMLTYSVDKANSFNTEQGFANDYFNPLAVTPEMIALGKQFKTYVTSAYQTIGKKWTTPSNSVLYNSLQLAPICVGIPVPSNVFNWIQPYVKYDGNMVLTHETELQEILPDGSRNISDQYIPDEKTLSPDYPLFICTQGIVYSLSKPSTAIPTPEQSYWTKFWTAVMNFWNGIPNSFPIGSV